MRVGLAIFALLSVSPSARLPGQDTTQVVPPADSSHLVRPMGAFWRSLLFPGWGQAATGRQTTGAIFVAWEGVTAMMTLKAQQEANYMKETGSANLRAKRQEVQDWLVLWVFNHLFSGAEAYVSAHLQDFPADLRIHAVPRGIGISVPLP
jgi:hypothetical protein